MNKKAIYSLVIIGAFTVGGASMVALQSRAQVTPVATANQVQTGTIQSGDQNDKPDKPDAVSETGSDAETNDAATSTISGSNKQSDVGEHDSGNNPNEVEDGQ